MRQDPPHDDHTTNKPQYPLLVADTPNEEIEHIFEPPGNWSVLLHELLFLARNLHIKHFQGVTLVAQQQDRRQRSSSPPGLPC